MPSERKDIMNSNKEVTHLRSEERRNIETERSSSNAKQKKLQLQRRGARNSADHAKNGKKSMKAC